MLITDLIAQFQDYLAGERGAANATVSAYTQTLHRLIAFLEEPGSAAHFEDLTTPLLRRFVAYLSRSGASNATVARHVHALRSFWRFVVETYDLGANAALPLRAPKPDHRLPQVLSVEECQRLIAATEKRHYRLYRVRDRVLLKLMLLVGLRRAEVIAARVTDYSQRDRTLAVVMSKGRRSRVVPLLADLCADIEAWLQVRPDCHHDRLLTTRTGGPISAKTIYRDLRALARLAGLGDRGITPHLLRHTAATLVLRSSGDLLATSRLLGHSSVAVTGDVYCHLSNDDVRRAVGCHPLAGQTNETGLLLDARLATWPDLALGDDAALMTEAEEIVEAALDEHRRALAGDPDRAQRCRDWCVLEAVRHNVRPRQALPPKVVRAIAWEEHVVEGYTIAEHMRMIALRDIIGHLSDLAASETPWSELLADLARRVSGAPVVPLEPWQRDRLDEIGQATRLWEGEAASALAAYTNTLAAVLLLDAFGPDCLLLAQVGANLAAHRRGLPLTFFTAWQAPLVRRLGHVARHGDSSPLFLATAARMAEVCHCGV